MEEDIRIIKFCSNDFEGFACDVDISNKTVENIEKECLTRLKKVLTENNFIFLIRKLESTTYHIHQTLENIKSSDPNEYIYIASCIKLKYN